jgi:hypothetical protein
MLSVFVLVFAWGKKRNMSVYYHQHNHYRHDHEYDHVVLNEPSDEF